MQELKSRYDNVLADLAECEMIRSIAVDTNGALAKRYRRVADALKQELNHRDAAILRGRDDFHSAVKLHDPPVTDDVSSQTAPSS